jgi:AcrR family transcriptional regulator
VAGPAKVKKGEARSAGTPAAKSAPAVARTGKYRLRQEAIIRSAVDVLNQKGVKGMTLADVAAKLNLVPTGIIYYFANKEDLAAACFLKAIEAYGRLIDEAAKGATAEERLAIFVRRYFAFRRDVATGVADPIAFFNDVRALGDVAVNEAYTDMFRRTRAVLEPDPEAEVDRPALNARTHHVLSQLFWAVAWLPQYDPDDYERAADRVLDILANGVGAAGQAWAPTPLVIPAAGATEEISRETFLRAATELINEQGYLGASVERISARLNVTKGSFYHHNEAKDDLVVACFERTVDIMRSAQRAADQLAASGWDRLCSTSAALVEFQVSGNAPLLRTSALTSVPETIRNQLIMKFDRVSGYFAAMISDGIADGSIRPIDANICAQMITGMLNAAAELGFWAPGMAPKQASNVFLQPLFEGMRAPTRGV